MTIDTGTNTEVEQHEQALLSLMAEIANDDGEVPGLSPDELFTKAGIPRECWLPVWESLNRKNQIQGVGGTDRTPSHLRLMSIERAHQAIAEMEEAREAAAQAVRERSFNLKERREWFTALCASGAKPAVVRLAAIYAFRASGSKHSKHGSRTCYAGEDQLAEDTGISDVRAIRRQRKWLVDHGWLVDTGERVNRATVWRLETGSG